jgi:Family of unknown function (DUF6338)
MSWSQSGIVQLLTFLLPGLVALAIFYGLTSHPKPSEFERVTQALIFTLIAQAVVAVLQSTVVLVGAPVSWTHTSEIIASIIVASALGLLAVVVTNTDTLHRRLRWLGITQETSYPSVWYSTFERKTNCYVVLHLVGERRLYGWPEEWPNRPNEGHFRIADPEWLVDDGRVELTGVEAILVPASTVEMIEFLPYINPNLNSDAESKDG